MKMMKKMMMMVTFVFLSSFPHFDDYKDHHNNKSEISNALLISGEDKGLP